MSEDKMKDQIETSGIAHDKVELREEDCAEKLGFAFSTMKKWTILR